MFQTYQLQITSTSLPHEHFKHINNKLLLQAYQVNTSNISTTNYFYKSTT